MIWVKALLFIGTVLSVKYIFTAINHDGDEKIRIMKEIINFTNSLRAYSCDMKMSIREICEKYAYKGRHEEDIIKAWINYLEGKKTSKDYLIYINKIMSTTLDFNQAFAEILDYYGFTYSDLLDKKLRFSLDEMERLMKEFSIKHNERKTLNNRISFLAGCLAAILLI